MVSPSSLVPAMAFSSTLTISVDPSQRSSRWHPIAGRSSLLGRNPRSIRLTGRYWLNTVSPSEDRCRNRSDCCLNRSYCGLGIVTIWSRTGGRSRSDSSRCDAEVECGSDRDGSLRGESSEHLACITPSLPAMLHRRRQLASTRSTRSVANGIRSSRRALATGAVRLPTLQFGTYGPALEVLRSSSSKPFARQKICEAGRPSAGGGWTSGSTDIPWLQRGFRGFLRAADFHFRRCGRSVLIPVA